MLYGNEKVDKEKTANNQVPLISSSEYWTEYNVTTHKQFRSSEESLEYLNWRFDQYPNYENLMPCKGFDDKVILDYGCGPGHDVVGFIEQSKPKMVIAMDVSSISLEETRNRIKLHNAENVEINLIVEKEGIDLADNSIDYIHSSGVLHHTPNLPEILSEFKRIIKPDGIIRIMVYNYHSIWAQLYVPYILQIENGIDTDLTHSEAFKRSTDGINCPISNCYTPDDFLDICKKSGLVGKFLGAGISIDELDWITNYRTKAIRDQRFPKKHRDFINQIAFDDKLRPLYKGEIAGIDAVYELKK